jgi:hypothetical protein
VQPGRTGRAVIPSPVPGWRRMADAVCNAGSTLRNVRRAPCCTLPNRKDRRQQLFRPAPWTPTRLGRARTPRKREMAVEAPGRSDDQALAVGLHGLADMQEVGFNLPLRNPERT